MTMLTKNDKMIPILNRISGVQIQGEIRTIIWYLGRGQVAFKRYLKVAAIRRFLIYANNGSIWNCQLFVVIRRWPLLEVR